MSSHEPSNSTASTSNTKDGIAHRVERAMKGPFTSKKSTPETSPQESTSKHHLFHTKNSTPPGSPQGSKPKRQGPAPRLLAAPERCQKCSKMAVMGSRYCEKHEDNKP
ncbi:MAG: hypothetical protein Q9159_005534 [Coniocarpon cinnabarinum]